MSRTPLLALLLALATGAATIAVWSQGLRWVALVILVWIAVLGLASMTRLALPIEKLLLFSFVLANSIRMDVYLIYVPGTFGFPIGMGDVWWLLLMLSWFFRQRRSPIRTEWPRKFCIPFVLLVLGGAIATIPNPYWSTSIRLVVFEIQSALTFLYLYNLRLEERDYPRLALGIMAALALQGVIGFLQGMTHSSLGLEFFGATSAAVNTASVTGYSRVGGTIGQPNRFAMFVNAVIFIPLAMGFSGWSARRKLLALGVFGCSFGALIFSQSRGAWMGFGLAFVPFAYLALRERTGRFLAGFAVTWAVLASVAFVLLFPPTYARLTAEDENSAYSRIPMALTALAMIEDNPLGVGFGQYVHEMNRYDVTEDGLTYRFRFPVHNANLLLAAEQGIPVALVYAILILTYYSQVFRLAFASPGFPRVLGLGFAAGMLAVHVQENVEIANPTINIHVWFAMGMVVQVLRTVQRREALRAGSTDADPAFDRPRVAAAPPAGG